VARGTATKKAARCSVVVTGPGGFFLVEHWDNYSGGFGSEDEESAVITVINLQHCRKVTPYPSARTASESSWEMASYKVKLVRDGKWDDDDQLVQAATEKEAAEKLFGRTLFKQGTNEQIRALVQAPGAGGDPTLFYDR
jgi:hypothetical protein